MLHFPHRVHATPQDPVVREVSAYVLRHPHASPGMRTRVHPIGDDPAWLSYAFALLLGILTLIISQLLYNALPADSGVRFTTALVLGGGAVLTALLWGWGPALPVVVLATVTAVFRIRHDPILASTVDDYVFVIGTTAIGFGAVCFIVGGISVGWAYTLERYRRLTERSQQAKSDLADIARDADEFLTIVSHELRTPLTSMQLALSLLKKQLATAGDDGLAPETVQQMRSYFETASLQTTRLSQFVSSITDAALATQKPLDITLQRMSLTDIVDETMQETRMLFPSRSILFKRPAELYFAECDPMRVSQVIHEFVSNACKFSSESDPVLVTLHADESKVYVTVRDEGVGVSSEVRDRIWDRFYHDASFQQAHSSSIGLGLGLYNSRRIIEQHSGEVGLRSSLGGGSAFWFALSYNEATATSPVKIVAPVEGSTAV